MKGVYASWDNRDGWQVAQMVRALGRRFESCLVTYAPSKPVGNPTGRVNIQWAHERGKHEISHRGIGKTAKTHNEGVGKIFPSKHGTIL